MAGKASSTLVFELRNWCRGEGIDSAKAILLTRVAEEAEVAFIEETLQQIKSLGRVRVRGKMFKSDQNYMAVLCECSETIDAATLLPDVMPLGGGDTWIITTAGDESHGTESFAEKLSTLLRDEGKTMEDAQALLSPNLGSGNSPESIIRAVGDLLEKTTTSTSESSVYRRLRTFSGVSPTPAGEENLESWSEQARLMVEECDCPVKEKKRRIVESLKGPALDIIQAVRLTNSSASPMEYIEALESAFGTSESGEDLYFAFRLLRQKPGELLSAFLRRIEKSLTKLVQKGGLERELADRARGLFVVQQSLI
ncbi:paraneoplastic antigen Ma1 homolog [Paramisgurnus dabryanus]|uniref:paraneoplastic antigen Ma1 homolog n=1 Tax=Paramisgurnus dabryanus TaxID=90735 RepID=UPI0031F430F0